MNNYGNNTCNWLYIHQNSYEGVLWVMKTTLTDVIKLFNDLLIPFKLKEQEDETILIIEVDYSIVFGYSGFMTEFVFDKKTGAFKRMGIWE